MRQIQESWYWLNISKITCGIPSLSPLPEPIEELLAPPQPNFRFTMFELYRAFRRTKTGRAPGPEQSTYGNSSFPPPSHQTPSSFSLQ